MRVTGRFHHVIDDQNRLAISSAIRNAMNPEVDGRALYLIPLLKEKQMLLMPEGLFDHYLEQLNGGLILNPHEAMIRRNFLDHIARLEMDKAGRVALPEEFLAWSKKGLHPSYPRLEREVTFSCHYDRIELWNRKEYEAQEDAQLEVNADVLKDGINKMFGPLLGKRAARLAEKAGGSVPPASTNPAA